MGKSHRDPDDLSSAELLRLVRKNRAKSRSVEKHQRWSLDDYRELGALLRESSERLDGLIADRKSELQSGQAANPPKSASPSLYSAASSARYELGPNVPKALSLVRGKELYDSNATRFGIAPPAATDSSNFSKPAKTPATPKYRIKPKESK